MRNKVLIGASSGPGLSGLQVIRDLKLGNCVLADLPFDREEALAMMRFCRENEITIFLSELVFRGTKDLYRPTKTRMPREQFWSREALNAVLDEAGDFYGGRMTIGEAGGILYWPKEYLIGEGVGAFTALGPWNTMIEARNAYIEYLRDFIRFEQEELSRGPLMNVESSLVFKYHCEAGIDVLCHEALPGDPHRMQAAIRGAARAYNKPWGTHIAMGWYGGITVDKLWMKRWKTSVWHCYLTGSEFIYPETGHLALKEHQSGHVFEPSSDEMKTARHILREAYQFSLIHERPAGGPKVTLGIVSGYGDGAPGLWNPWAWGQYHDPKWLAGPPEHGWELVDQLHRREEWSNYTVSGERDWSGNPPDGQYDIVPIESSLENLQHYGCLVFLGWNTMTAEIYEKLKAYVQGGGHLLMFLPQVSTHEERGAALQVYNGGDLSDLFGVKVTGWEPQDVRGIKFLFQSSLPGYRLPVGDIECDPRFMGNFTPARLELATARVLCGHDVMFSAEMDDIVKQPVLVENRLGEGVAMLVTLAEYPGDTAVVGFAQELLRVVSAGEQSAVRLLASDRVRYAVYDLERAEEQVIYLLNTDPDCAAPARLAIGEALSSEFTIPANEFLVAYQFGNVLVQPANRNVDLVECGRNDTVLNLKFNALKSQQVLVQNLGPLPCTVTLNGSAVELAGGSTASVTLDRCEDPDNPAYAPDFLQEPVLAVEIDGRTAY